MFRIGFNNWFFFISTLPPLALHKSASQIKRSRRVVRGVLLPGAPEF